MIKLDSNQVAVTDPITSYTDLKPARRLIVLVPANSDPSTATRRIWELADTTGAYVQFLGLCKDAAQEPSLRRCLLTITLLLQAGQISAEMKVEIGTTWFNAVETNYEEADVIVCLPDPPKELLQQVVAWLGFMGIIVGFGMLQAQVVQLAENWLQNVLLLFSILPELWLLWAWNTLFS